MNELIPLTEQDGVQAVMGRDLYKFLGVKEQYTDWMRRMITYGFEEGRDYSSQKPEAGATSAFVPGGNRTDHIVTLDMAKEIAMIQRTERGKQARQYFIEVEKQARRPKIDGSEITRMELIQIAMNAETERLALEAKNKELEPKADAYDTFLSADGTYSIGAVAKMLGKSQNKLFELLRNDGILIAKGAMRNTPYQKYMHHFHVKAHEYERKDGTRGTSYTTRVQPTGIDFIRKKLGMPRIDPELPLNTELGQA